MSETIYMRGRGGAVWEMTLPLPEYIAKQYEAGDLVRVNQDGSPFTEDAPKPRSRRAKAAEDSEGA